MPSGRSARIPATRNQEGRDPIRARQPLTILLAAAATALAVAGAIYLKPPSGAHAAAANAQPLASMRAPAIAHHATRPVVTVGKTVISETDLDAALDRTRHSYQRAGLPFPTRGTSAYARLVTSTLQALIINAELAAEARRVGIYPTQRELREQQLEKSLKTAGTSVSDYTTVVRQQLIQQKIDAWLLARVHVSRRAVDAYYRKHNQQLEQPATRELRQIVVDNKQLAYRIYQQLLAGRNFAALLKKYTIDAAGRSRGGRITVTKGRATPAFDRIAFTLATGHTAAPVQSPYGWHIIQALAPTRPAATTPKARAYAQIQQTLRDAAAQNAKTRWLSGLQRRWRRRIHYAQKYRRYAT